MALRALCLLLVAAALPAAALAARVPTESDRAALLRAFHVAAPPDCVGYDVHVSGAWAEVEPVFAPAPRCVRYAGNGFALLRRGRAGWRRAYAGSEPPPCA